MKEKRICNLEQLKKLHKNIPAGAALRMNELLQDEAVKPTDMFEELAGAYLDGSDEFKHGMDRAMNILLWHDMQDVADMIEKLTQEEGKE